MPFTPGAKFWVKTAIIVPLTSGIFLGGQNSLIRSKTADLVILEILVILMCFGRQIRNYIRDFLGGQKKSGMLGGSNHVLIDSGILSLGGQNPKLLN